MNNDSPTTTNIDASFNPNKIIKSALLIILLTIVFGTLSFGFIQLNAAVLKLSVPESLWCGLAMSLAAVYYLFKSKRNK